MSSLYKKLINNCFYVMNSFMDELLLGFLLGG